MYVYVKYSALRVKFMRVTLLRAQWEVPRTMPAAERDGKMRFKRRIVNFLKTDAQVYSAVKICIQFGARNAK